MERLPFLVDLDPASIETLPCCGVKNAAHEGRCNKIRWLKAQFKKGLRAKVLLTPDRRQCGYIEHLPGEHAWRRPCDESPLSLRLPPEQLAAIPPPRSVTMAFTFQGDAHHENPDARSARSRVPSLLRHRRR
jgi:hypothetical protein